MIEDPALIDDDAGLPPATLQYLEAAASASFKRQEELDESVWRTLPFFAAALGLAVTIVSHLATTVPNWRTGLFAIVSNMLLILACLAFAWAFRWFWSVVALRTYQYPAADNAVQNYARQLVGFHRLERAEGYDEVVLADLRNFAMIEFSEATRTNRLNNVRKLKARSQAILFTLSGFALAFGCGVLIFLHDAYVGPHSGDDHGAIGQRIDEQASGQAPCASATEVSGRGRAAIDCQHGAPILDGAAQMSNPPPKSPTPAKPTPPPLQILKKTEDSGPLKKR